jgi:dolichol-phosphate mannosyltransferase
MIYFLIPVFNEEENIPALADNLIGADATPCFFVFTDDGSSDRSCEVIKQKLSGQKYVLLGDGKNHGPGHAFNVGFNWILEHSANSEDLVVTLEADNTSDINILSTMIILAKQGFDLVLASPYAQGGGFSKTSWLRKTLSFVANMVFRLIFDIKVLTLSSFYRVYRIPVLRAIKAKSGQCIEQLGYLCMLEILVKALHQKARIIEVPMMLHSDKRAGKSKMKLWKTSMAYLRFLLTSKKYSE